MGYLYGANTYGSGLYGLEYTDVAGTLAVGAVVAAAAMANVHRLDGNISATVPLSASKLNYWGALAGDLVVAADLNAAPMTNVHRLSGEIVVEATLATERLNGIIQLEALLATTTVMYSDLIVGPLWGPPREDSPSAWGPIAESG